MENKKIIVIHEVPYKVLKKYFEEEKTLESLKAIRDYEEFVKKRIKN